MNSHNSSHNKLPGISSQNGFNPLEEMNKTTFATHKASLVDRKNPRDKYEVPRYKGLQDKRREMVSLKRKKDKAEEFTFKPKINPRKDVAKSLNFYQG